METPKKIKWYRVGAAGSIPLKEGRRVQCGEQTLALFNLGGAYRAVENQCPHKSGPLADGIVSGQAVFCPLHNWKINLESGCALSGGTGQVKTYPVKVLENIIYVACDEGRLQPSGDASVVPAPVHSKDAND